MLQTGSVLISFVVKIVANTNSFHINIYIRTIVVMTPGVESGSAMVKKDLNGEQPSILLASINSLLRATSALAART